MKNYDYVSTLCEHLEARKIRNSSYGLRSFARDLDLSPASLSLVLKGKQGLSPERGKCIASRLKLNTGEEKLFLLDIKRKGARKKVVRENAELEYENIITQSSWLQHTHPMESLLKRWEFVAIFDVIKGREKTTKSYLREYFDFPYSLIDDCIHVLLENNLIIERDGEYCSEHNKDKIDSPISSKVIQNFHHQVLDQAKKSIDHLELEDREITSTFLTVDKSVLSDLKKEMEQFRVQLCDKYGISDAQENVTTIGLSLNFFKIGEES